MWQKKNYCLLMIPFHLIKIVVVPVQTTTPFNYDNFNERAKKLSIWNWFTLWNLKPRSRELFAFFVCSLTPSPFLSKKKLNNLKESHFVKFYSIHTFTIFLFLWYRKSDVLNCVFVLLNLMDFVVVVGCSKEHEYHYRIL